MPFGFYKPDSVHPLGLCDHFSHVLLNKPCMRAGCNYYPGILSGQATLPLFVLHRVGFTVPPLLPSERWALTPPFHPYPCGRFVFCGTFRPPGISSGCLPLSKDTLPCDVRTFLYTSVKYSGHPNPNGRQNLHQMSIICKPNLKLIDSDLQK